MQTGEPYPESHRGRREWIESFRPERNAVLDPFRPYAFQVETECSAEGHPVPVATVFLTNRECPWRCLMCDLWKNTLTEAVPEGAIPAQIDFALDKLAPARQIKLYNSGSFFDHQAIPPADYEAIAERLQRFERVIVEAHPALIGEDCLRFRDLVAGRLEVAVGLETAHPEVLQALNKQCSLNDFSRAATFLHSHDIDLRVFILIQPPFMEETDSLYWARKSLDFAFECGANVTVLIPTRTGNGAMEILATQQSFTPPDLRLLEEAMKYGIRQQRGRVFADLWDLEQFSRCPHCFGWRESRLRKMNLLQTVLPAPGCKQCGLPAGD